MPIKLPKGFARRKSSGNALEEGENPPQSFRVFERPSVDKKSYSEGNLLAKRLSDGQRFYPTAEDSDNIFAEADSPGQRSPGGLHERPKSARFNSATHRLTDGPNPSDTPASHSRNLYDIPIPPLTGALRAAGRTFSFGGRFSKASAPTPPPQPSTPGPSRSRAMTASTTSTATPPKLLDTDLQLGQGEDEFHNMFDNVGKREASRERSGDMFPPSSELVPRKQEKSSRPTPINTDRSKEIEPSPYSWDSRHSGEGLLMASDSPQDHTLALQQTPNSHPVSPEDRRISLPLSSVVPRTTTHRSLEQPQAMPDKNLRRSVLYPSKRASTPMQDEDAKLIMESLYTHKRSSQVLLSSEHEDSDAEHDTPLFSNSHVITADGLDRSDANPMLSHKSLGGAEDHPDPSIAAHARLAAQYEERQPAPTASSSNKVMTPSQFEHYRQQQELRRSNSDASKSDDSAESEFDEEDEAEKNREVERQRRKQEAHLSVYRQQMMKVTGQESPAPALRSEADRANNSTPNLTVTPLNSGHRSGSGKSSDGDEDEEIPLGILAAHGFPNRNRPPSRLVPSNSIPNLRASFHQPYISSSSSIADQEPGNRSSLPVFARNLPRDPYFGASLVNPTNRESLAFGGGSSVYGGPVATAGPSPALPPGGLVGVIATEERARAMRRGSPNTQAMYEYQGGPSTVPAPPSGIPRPYTMMSMNLPGSAGPPSGISATEQAQIQLSQQMSSMMQMQMQWMQQIIQMQSGQVPPQQLAPPAGSPPTAAANANMRPSSMPSAGGVNHAPAAYRNDQRTLSMLDPNVSSRLNSPVTPYNVAGDRPSTPAGQGYTPSIAPSERSNVGLAPRYRPVSVLQPESGPSPFPFISKSWSDENQESTLSVPPTRSLQTRPTIDRTSSGNKSAIAGTTGHGADPDDDDDEGWAEMMKKREKKRNNWKMKKETSSFGDLLNAVH